jgi:hypothetical protein
MEIDAWKQHIRSQWQNIEVRSVKIPNSTSTPFNQGEEFVAEVVIHTNGIAPEHIGVDIVVGQKEFDRVNKVYRKKELELTKHGDEEGTWSCTMSLKESGVFDFAFRIFPKHEFLPHRQDFIQVKWI